MKMADGGRGRGPRQKTPGWPDPDDHYPQRRLIRVMTGYLSLCHSSPCQAARTLAAGVATLLPSSGTGAARTSRSSSSSSRCVPGVLVGDDGLIGTRRQLRIEPTHQGGGGGRAHHLGGDEGDHVGRPDAGERVGERAAQRDRGVGEAGGAGKEVRGGNVGTHGDGRAPRPPSAYTAPDHQQEAKGGQGLGAPKGRG